MMDLNRLIRTGVDFSDSLQRVAFFPSFLCALVYNEGAFLFQYKCASMLWIVSALGGYLLTALAGVTDKFLVSDRIEKPAAYIFLLTLFSLVSFIFAPFGLRMLPPAGMAIFFVSGTFFSWSLLYLYRAFRIGEVSKILPLVGIFSAMVAFLPSLVRTIVSGEVPLAGIAAFLLLLVGAVLVSFSGFDARSYSRESVRLSFVSGALLAFFYLFLKLGEGSGANFVSGLVWSRVGVFLGGLSLLLVAPYRRDILSYISETLLPAVRMSWRTVLFPWRRQEGRYSTWTLFIGGKTLGGLGALFIIFATYRPDASVAIIQALVGAQFAFVFLIAILLSGRFPKVFTERMSLSDWVRKGIAFLCLSIGVWLALRGGSSLF